jgi:hypothetical protein
MREPVTAMLGWARGDGRVAWREPRVNEDLRRSVAFVRSTVEGVRQRLVELELRSRLVEVEGRSGLGLREIEGSARSVVRGLVEKEVALGRPARGCHGRGPVGQIEVNEDGPDDGWIGEEGEDPHLTAAARTQERQNFVDPCEKLGPADSRGSG